MSGLFFQNQSPIIRGAPNRADIACFVGFVGRRNTAIPTEIERWLSDQGWTALPYKRIGPALLTANELKFPIKFASKLLQSRSPSSIDLLSKHLGDFVSRLTPGLLVPRLLEGHETALPSPEALRRSLASGVNEAIETENLYTAERFAGIELNAAAQALIERAPQGEELIALNRLLLEQAYPDEIGKSRSASIGDLLDLPVPIDNWETFDYLFAWDERQTDGINDHLCPTYIGAAVRSFFAQGGRKCYVVRVGDPLPLTANRETRINRIGKLLPGFPHRFTPSPIDRRSWHGIGHLFGLPDISFLCLPDLPDLISVEREQVELPRYATPPEEQFVECSEDETLPAPEDRSARMFRAPRCDEQGYSDWARAWWLTANVIARYRREVQAIAAVPIPQRGTSGEENLLDFLMHGDDGSAGPLANSPLNQVGGIASAFVQLVYPWVRTDSATNLPEGIESPDAILAGLLAQSALARGAFRSAAGSRFAGVSDLYPHLRRDQMLTPPRADETKSHLRRNLLERVSLLGPTPRGLRLLSDVTTSLDESYRPASVNRLVSVIVRAARRIGEEIIFEASGERLWFQIRQSLNNLLAGLLQAGALRGATSAEAFQVRCDRSTMSQSDIDNGRVIVLVQFAAAAPIEQITVVLAMDEGGQVSLLAPELAGLNGVAA